MKIYSTLVVMLLVWMTSCTRSSELNWPEKLSQYKTGMDASALIEELQTAGYPKRSLFSTPPGEEYAIYFLADGDLHLAVEVKGTNCPVMISEPFFVISPRSVEKRISVWENQFKRPEK